MGSNFIAIIDAALAGWFPPLPRLILWAVLSAAASMVIYARFSPQVKLVAIKSAQKESRRNLIGYDGDFDGLFPLIRQDLRLAFKQLALVTPPFLLAAVPLIWLMMTLSALAGEQLYSTFGPEWSRGFDFWYIAVALIVSIIIKITFRIS